MLSDAPLTGSVELVRRIQSSGRLVAHAAPEVSLQKLGLILACIVIAVAIAAKFAT